MIKCIRVTKETKTHEFNDVVDMYIEKMIKCNDPELRDSVRRYFSGYGQWYFMKLLRMRYPNGKVFWVVPHDMLVMIIGNKAYCADNENIFEMPIGSLLMDIDEFPVVSKYFRHDKVVPSRKNYDDICNKIKVIANDIQVDESLLNQLYHTFIELFETETEIGERIHSEAERCWKDISYNSGIMD